MINVQVGISQEIDWNEYTGRTGIKVICDTPDVPVYLNGDKAGVTPMEKVIEVPGGWHHVSLFPEVDQDSFVPERIRNIQKLGSRKIFVKHGEISTVTLSYRSLDQEADVVASEDRSAAWVGHTLFLITVIVVIWGML